MTILYTKNRPNLMPPCPCGDCEDGDIVPYRNPPTLCKLLNLKVESGQDHCDLFIKKVEA